MKRPKYFLENQEKASFYCEYEDCNITKIEKTGKDIPMLRLLRELVVTILEENNEDFDDFCIELNKYHYFLTHYEEEFERFEDENGELDIEVVDDILEEKFGVSCRI